MQGLVPAMLVAPTEPPELRAAGTTNLKTETYGADILILPHLSLGAGWIGVQRKTVADLIASVPDGRLGQQVAQMAGTCLMSFVCLEGRPTWTNEGELHGQWGMRVTKAAWDSTLLTVRSHGIHVVHVANLRGTIEFCRDLEAWAKKPGHTALTGRSGPPKDAWGVRGARAWERHLLQGFQGMGPEIADRIIDKFGGVPLAWTVTAKELMEVPGVGKKRAEGLMKALEHRTTDKD